MAKHNRNRNAAPAPVEPIETMGAAPAPAPAAAPAPDVETAAAIAAAGRDLAAIDAAADVQTDQTGEPEAGAAPDVQTDQTGEPGGPPPLPAPAAAIPAIMVCCPNCSTQFAAALPAGVIGGARGGKRAAAAPAGPRKVSALDAAAIVLDDSAEPMNARQIIDAMSARLTENKAGGWVSENGATPAATLAAAIVREIAAKGTAARFVKVGPGAWVSRKNAA